MKVTRTILLSAFLLPCCFATLNSSVVMEVRTTGSNSNGGGFDPSVSAPGTDYSQQDSAQCTMTDFTLGAGNNSQATSASCPVGADWPGNLVTITTAVSGSCTAGTYEISSRSATVAQADRGMGTNGSVCNAKMGGAMADPKAALAISCNSSIAMWLKAGTYTMTSTSQPTNGCGFHISGYNSTRGDRGTKPLITTATNSTTLFQNNGNNPISFDNVAFSNTASTRASLFTFGSGVNQLSVSNCTFTGFNGTIPSTIGANSLINVTASAFISDVGTVFTMASNQGLFLTNSYFYGSGTSVISADNANKSTIIIKNSILANSTGIAVNVGCCNGGSDISLTVTGSTLANNGSDAIKLQMNASSLTLSLVTLSGNIFYGNGGYGLNNAGCVSGCSNSGLYSNLPAILVDHNGWGSNTSGNYTANIPAGTGDVTFGATPFTNSAGQDFSLNSIANGGALAKGAGVPGPFPAGSTTGFSDMGAVQTGGAISVTVGYPLGN